MESNKNKIFAVIAIGVLILLLIGSTFAYFAAQGGDASQTDVNVLTHTVDSLAFETGDALSITADQNTFAQGKGNQTDSTFARATLKANSSTNTATDNYYVYLSIDDNTFEYTTAEKTAELILTVNKVEGETKTPVTTIDGLNYVTVGSVSGFDITEVNDLITIANNYEITSNGTKTDEWELILTLVNLDSNQNANTGKVFNAQLLIQKEESFAGHIMSLYTTDGENNLYLHDKLGNYEYVSKELGDNSLRYSGGDYTLVSKYQEQYTYFSAGMNTTSKNYLIIKMCGANETTLGASCNAEEIYFYMSYDTNEEKKRYLTYKDAINGAITDGYIEETPVNNYVCFADDCANYDDLYRIIGVFNGKVKLIKADYAGENLLGSDGDAFISNESESESKISQLYLGTRLTKNTFYWNSKNKDVAFSNAGKYNDWNYSELNIINLNTNFLNNIGEEWANKIYGSIGILDRSDYLKAGSPKWWSANVLQGVNLRDNDWIYLGDSEWTMNPYTAKDNILQAYHIGSSGVYSFSGDVYSNHYAVRPTFYLKSSVTFAGGTGTATDPYRIA